MGKQYVITDGIKFIKLNEKSDPIKVNQIALATIFNSIVQANNLLLSPQMVKINKDNGKRRFNIEEIEGELNSTKSETNEAVKMEDDILKEIKELDGVFKDFDEIKMSDRYNRHVYTGKTLMEEDGFDFPEYIKETITRLSELENYVENMAYLEQETDLKILDIRHYKRDENTKLNAIEAQSLEYLEQELERERITYKRNKIVGSIILKKISRIQDPSCIKVVESLINSEYKYRRLDKSVISDMIKSKKSNRLKAV